MADDRVVVRWLLREWSNGDDDNNDDDDNDDDDGVHGRRGAFSRGTSELI